MVECQFRTSKSGLSLDQNWMFVDRGEEGITTVLKKDEGEQESKSKNLLHIFKFHLGKRRTK